MIGVAREGKSFLLNLYMNYLNHLAKVSTIMEMIKIGSFLKQELGVPWGKSEEAVTEGISVWSKPFIIEQERVKGQTPTLAC
ncbi:hypothetical protein EB796_008445 [Bugula neritina]|uniref:Guanylate-binding protein N-terminal domain-containing protein n=1 Tax=Bugula neritina TaxID=10212 RepID=A0A7J7K4V3_BUGNE|nr:hypothetical protein EB796_008445 [Bugula neritina]